ncbi:glycoside hydrolase family protein [Fusobacterium ulcerans]|uniref:hypothetical protein n=1 Tax=Fusobacterium ulcerans TaxID=861 RepID=UPI001D0BDF89|nr:hypothetical protein [Fusobacterium ulcerans]MCB8566036.1 hypothetical protein [Fusobacterium ulcerans]MCB8650043.1 hypothetical protein [Fusobacterium ulcerans]
MKWKKLGKIFEINNSNKKEWCESHTSNPIAINFETEKIRVYFSTRDKYGKSNIGSFDYSIKEKKVTKIAEEPVMLHGKENEIDESGIGIGNIIKIKEEFYLYYMAWQTPRNEHWRGDIARGKLDIKTNKIIRDDDFCLGIDNEIDKISLSYPFIIKKDRKYYMWYGSTITWNYGNGEMLHIINWGTSIDGKEFVRNGKAVNYEIGKAQAFSRPTVIYWNKKWRMWFSYRGNKDLYKIGYAESTDLENWEIKDSNFYTSDSNWDSEMVCYPFVFEYKEKLYMLYNGNGYGKTGIGLAVLEEE